MTTKINNVYNQVEDWSSDDIHRLISELMSLLDIKEESKDEL